MDKQYSYDELVKQIEALTAELNTARKYGLVWDKESQTEEIVELCKKNIPYLKMDSSRTIKNGMNNNVLIEGDNFHALTALNYLMKEFIDVIYIDPPYNTGNKDFMYNDSFVDDEDGFRHSKWLTFMSRRLKLAKNLLKPSGVFFVSIDDNEQATLKLLCDSIFGERNFIASLPRITKKSGKDHAIGIAKNHDYVLVYCKNKSEVAFQGMASNDEDYPLRDEFYDTRGGYKLNQTLDYDSLWYNPAMDFPISVGEKTYYPGGTKESHDARHNGNHKAKDWVWRWSIDKFRFGLDNGFVVIKEGKGRPRIYTKTYSKATISNSKPYKIEIKDRETLLSSITLVNNEFSNDNAKKEITKVGLEEFGFPKPLNLIKQLVSIVKNAEYICDFFAGSGTTGQAVLEMNASDGGNRKFILCTNNENGICENITYQRLKTVISGVKKDGTEYSTGIPANLYYFKTDFIENQENTDQAKYCLVEKVDSLLCILENVYDEIERNDYSSHYSNGQNHLFIYNDYYNKERFEEFKNRVINCEGSAVVYIFSTDNNVDETLFDTDKVIVKPIPSKIYEIYKEIVEGIKRGE